MTDPRPHGDLPGTFSFLALGDSYTIGEGVTARESFPWQTIGILKESGKSVRPPQVIAKTGWTTTELTAAMALSQFLPSYEFVSLLIGVTNEYRGLPLEEYERDFRQLLLRAISLSGNRPNRVFVLSIPDWSSTPFATTYLPDKAGRDAAAIAREIDAFNATALGIAKEQGTVFIEITKHTRLATAEFAADGLHPSAKEYRHWAEQLAQLILEKI
jgi:lysophospholipase L1-like esterase